MPRIAILYNEPTLAADHPDYASEAGVLESVAAFAAALGNAGHEVRRIGLGRSIAQLMERLTSEQPDVVVNFCEGFGGHSSGEAYVAGVLELIALPYTGSSPECLALVRDKCRTKQVLVAGGVPTAPYWIIRRDEGLRRSSNGDKLQQALSETRLFVKPAAEDASLGIDERSVVSDWDNLVEKVEELQTRYGDVLVEQYLDGREFNVGVIALPDPVVLPLAEIEFQTGEQFPWPIVTYHSKWTENSAGYRGTPVRCPAAVDDLIAASIQETALAAFRATGCRDYARVDLRVTANGGVYVLEVNANPDLAPSAGFARALAAAGIAHDDFALRLVETAAIRCPDKRPGGPTCRSPARKGGINANRASGAVQRSDTQGLRIRALEALDRTSLLELLAACQMFRPDEIQIAGELLDEALRDGVTGHYRVLVAEADGQSVGWSCHGRVPLTDATYDLYWIAVHPSCQGRGVGRALLVEIERLLRQADARWLLAETSSSSMYDKTREFYERAGFMVVGNVPDFYRPQDGRITFGKRLTK
ncbi:MAG: GNAT family N-acetyltransferase [Pirellulales bacterium]